MRKITFVFVLIVSLFGGIVAGAVVKEVYYPKIEYQIEEQPLITAYTDIPLDLGTIWIDTPYEWLLYNETETPAIQVKREGNLTVGLSSINATHFSEFTVEVWNVTESPYVKVGSFDLTNRDLTFTTGPANYSYALYYTVDANAPYGTTGTVELEVFLENI